MSAATLPLVGRFHEFSIATADIRASIEFYEQLGFTQAATSDALEHPYGVLSDGRLYLGLHQRHTPSPTLTFVRPGIAASHAAFTAAGIELSVCRTGEEVFNEIGFSDPGGQAIAVLEARTYSPLARGARDYSLCGEFVQVSLPAGDFAAAQAFWEPLGFVAAEEAAEPYPQLPLTSDTLDIAFHSPRLLPSPALVFSAPDMGARLARLRELGVEPAAAPRAVSAPDSALLASPDGTTLLLLGQPG